MGYGEHTALAVKRHGEWQKWTYKKYRDDCVCVAKAMIEVCVCVCVPACVHKCLCVCVCVCVCVHVCALFEWSCDKVAYYFEECLCLVFCL